VSRRVTHVYKHLNKRRTICGVDPPLFQLAVLLSLITLNQLNSLRGALLMFVVLIVPARVVTRKDPQMLAIVLAADKFRARYDPLKRAARPILVVGSVGEATRA